MYGWFGQGSSPRTHGLSGCDGEVRRKESGRGGSDSEGYSGSPEEMITDKDKRPHTEVALLVHATGRVVGHPQRLPARNVLRPGRTVRFS